MASLHLHKIKHPPNSEQRGGSLRDSNWVCELVCGLCGPCFVRTASWESRAQPSVFHSLLTTPSRPVRYWGQRRSSPRWPARSHLFRFSCCPCGYSCSPGLCDGASPPVASSSPGAAALSSVCLWPEREDAPWVTSQLGWLRLPPAEGRRRADRCRGHRLPFNKNRENPPNRPKVIYFPLLLKFTFKFISPHWASKQNQFHSPHKPIPNDLKKR